MLHLETVEPHTFSILEELMSIKELENFYLVGGTALSLLYGHRISVDLDLFSTNEFENEDITSILKKHFASSFIEEDKPNKFGIFCFIDNVKVDIIRYSHPLIFPTQTVQKIRMYSVQDIMAMKIQAILGRGKKKDFWDIAELLQHFTIQDFIEYHKQKFSTQNLLITVPQVLTYFDDANDGENPISLKNQTWESVQQFINQKVREYLK